ncbi:MAG TPA: hypothetical protein PLS23_20980, partial [Phycisphaerae bacterium]|nr:hypothetical protein [Phycisphaerae bacterium]
MNRMWHTTGMSLVTLLAGVTVALVLSSGCDSKGGQKGETASAGQSPATLPAGTLLTQAPEGAVNVAEAKSTAQKGDRITVRGRIGGVAPTAMLDLAKPAYKMGLAEVRVGWAAHELAVKVTPDRPVFKVR